MCCDILNISNLDVISATDVGHFKFMEIQFCPACWFSLNANEMKGGNAVLGGVIATAWKWSTVQFYTFWWCGHGFRSTNQNTYDADDKCLFVLVRFCFNFLCVAFLRPLKIWSISVLSINFNWFIYMHVSHCTQMFFCFFSDFRTDFSVCNVYWCSFVDTYSVNSQTHTQTLTPMQR